MRDTYYYYEYFEPHKVFYSINSFGYRHFDRIWCQGPQGGVRVVTENFMNDKYLTGEKKYYGRKYVTKNENAMREFAWIKLKAQPFERST